MTTEENRLAKNKRIKEAGMATRTRRAQLDCRVYHLKLQPNKTIIQKLRLLFKEAKWLRNASLSAQNFNVSFLKTIASGIPVQTPNGEELRNIAVLGSQMQQGILTQLRSDLKSLNARKNKGYKVGKLNFVRSINSINLQQLGTTYDLNFEKSKARIQSIGWVKVRGLKQLDGFKELANAKLLQKPDGFYLAVTAYFPKNSKSSDFTRNSKIGIDMGVATHVTLSDGRKFNSTVQETDRLKRLQRKLSRQIKGSKNRLKTISKIKKEYLKMDYKKNDFSNKLVHELLQYETVYLQDEQLTTWKVRNGKKLQHSALGKVKSKLIAHDRSLVLSKYAPTTQFCECGVKTKHDVRKRTFVCSSCGFTEDRDVHAAQNMIKLADNYTLGTKGSACGGPNKTRKALKLREQGSAKQETPMTSVSV